MAFHLLQRQRSEARVLAQEIVRALDTVQHCRSCNNFSLEPQCPICTNSERDPSRLCIVETPADLAAMERTSAYYGRYFVLMGRLSPLSEESQPNLEVADLAVLKLRLQTSKPEITEVIIATSFTAEGEATAHLIAELVMSVAPNSKVTRLARGVPVGSELEFVDAGTIAHALQERR